MAQGNIIQGQASGKLGDTVLMVRNGTQVSRVYTTSGARSGETASYASRLQRVRFGSASNEWQLYRYICTRMFRKGRSTNQSDYNYFVKRNVDNLPYLTKLENADGVCCMMPGQFSEGTLGRIELLSAYGKTSTDNRLFMAIKDTINPPTTSLDWSDTIGGLKASLKKTYTSARKITYLLVTTSINQFNEGDEVFVSQFFQHHPVIIDLYAESVSGEDAMTIKEYFAQMVADDNLKTVINAQNSRFQSGGASMWLYSTSEGQDSIVESVGALLFATNDLVSDCYTTILPAANVSANTGVYKVWAQYRTNDALIVAADSYGYQTGVMRDVVASNDNASETQAANYTRRLRTFEGNAAEQYVESLEEANSPYARAARAALEE